MPYGPDGKYIQDTNNPLAAVNPQSQVGPDAGKGWSWFRNYTTTGSKDAPNNPNINYTTTMQMGFLSPEGKQVDMYAFLPSGRGQVRDPNFNLDSTPVKQPPPPKLGNLIIPPGQGRGMTSFLGSADTGKTFLGG